MVHSYFDRGREIAVSRGCRQIGSVRVMNPAPRQVAAHSLLQLVLEGKIVECGLQKPAF